MDMIWKRLILLSLSKKRPKKQFLAQFWLRLSVTRGVGYGYG